MSRFVRRSRLAAAAFLSFAASAASADTVYHVFADFVGGGTLTGTFTLDQYGYLTDRDLVSTAGSLYPGFAYTNLNTSRDSSSNPTDSPFFVALFPTEAATGQPQYTSQLRLTFAHTLTDTSQLTYDITASNSFECFGDYDCGLATPGSRATPRYISRGYVTSATSALPEPAGWATMIIGFGLVGAAMRRPSGYRLSAERPA